MLLSLFNGQPVPCAPRLAPYVCGVDPILTRTDVAAAEALAVTLDLLVGLTRAPGTPFTNRFTYGRSWH